MEEEGNFASEKRKWEELWTSRKLRNLLAKY
jgi:hypothetical protein